jgi:hypothetical protein
MIWRSEGKTSAFVYALRIILLNMFPTNAVGCNEEINFHILNEQRQAAEACSKMSQSGKEKKLLVVPNCESRLLILNTFS